MRTLEAEILRASGETLRLPMDLSGEPEHLLLTLPRQNLPEDFALIRLLPGLLDAHAGEEGYYVLPYPAGPCIARFHRRDDCKERFHLALLPLLGKVSNGEALTLVPRGMALGMEAEAEVRDGKYTLCPILRREYSELYEDISLELHTLRSEDADYSGMARLYRREQLARGDCRSLRDKAAERPLLRELAETPEIRIRMGWKPVPSPVMEQTPETEPPMHMACTFADVERLVQELKRQGVTGAEICLVGWNIRGHDGRWPQTFPVEPALGGEEALRPLIRTATEAGYRIVCHTNSTDGYTISEDWDENDTIRRRDGSMSTDTSWSGGRMYELCPERSMRYAQRDLPRIRAMGFSGAHYIDVISTVPPRACYDPRHPLNRKQCAARWRDILAYGASQMGAIASEGIYDFTAGVLDFGLYSAFHIMEGLPRLADESIPLAQLVYHGILLYNPSAETVNYPVKTRAARLKFYEYGGRPAIYYYSKFLSSGVNWMGEADFTMDTPEEIATSAARIRAVCDEYRPLASLQYAFMERHQKRGENVYETVYSDGTRMLFNYGAEPTVLDGVTVPGEDFVVLPTAKR